MIIRLLAAAVALFAMTAPAIADELACERNLTFKREFAADIPGGRYQIGEDPVVTLRFRETGSIAADVQIIEPHRTKEFGTGVAFLFCDATKKKGVRVAFTDDAKSKTLSVVAMHMTGENKEPERLIPQTFLTVSKKANNRVTFRVDEGGQLVIGAGGQAFTIDPGFDVFFLHVQIYCSNSRVRFLENELIS